MNSPLLGADPMAQAILQQQQQAMNQQRAESFMMTASLEIYARVLSKDQSWLNTTGPKEDAEQLARMEELADRCQLAAMVLAKSWGMVHLKPEAPSNDSQQATS